MNEAPTMKVEATQSAGGAAAGVAAVPYWVEAQAETAGCSEQHHAEAGEWQDLRAPPPDPGHL